MTGQSRRVQVGLSVRRHDWTMPLGRRLRRIAIAAALVIATACTSDNASSSGRPTESGRPSTTEPARAPRTHSPGPGKDGDRPTRVAARFRNPLPGMPPILGGDVYAAAGAGDIASKAAHDPAYLYVPNSYGAPTTTVIDQRTHKIVRVLHTGVLSQHVTPSWDLRTLFVEASGSNQLVAINPRSGRIERRIPMPRPYNLYFTPDGRQAVVMSEQYNAIVFADAQTFHRTARVTSPSCRGPNHADFSANGRFFVVTCEFSDSLLKVSTLRHRVIGQRDLAPGSMPQDIRLSPDGRMFFVAEMGRNRLTRVAWRTLRPLGHTDMPSMPHGIYPSRDGRSLYVSDRGAGKVSVVSLRSYRIVDTWTIPGGGTPDMGGVSADGRILWLSGRDDGEVYGWNTHTGRLIARIHVGGSPHGLAVWPQPGRYSLGHTGNMR
jgi:DNA-binding beta-propeller fold protein YncE